MKDGYRYFISRPPAEGGDLASVLAHGSRYFRVRVYGKYFMPRGEAEFWSVDEWETSRIQPFGRYLDGILASGSTVRELLDEKEVPGGLGA
jgi:hypothetical protein